MGESKREEREHCPAGVGIFLSGSSSALWWIVLVVFISLVLMEIQGLTSGRSTTGWMSHPAVTLSVALIGMIACLLGARSHHALRRKLTGEALRNAQAEQALRDSARLNNLLLDSLPHPAMLARRDRTVLTVNRAAQEAGIRVGVCCWDNPGGCGCLSEEHKGALDANARDVSSRRAPCSFCGADAAFEEGRCVTTFEISAFGRLWNMWWIPVDGEVYFHFAVDITDQKMSEEALRRSEERLRSLSSQLLTTQEHERKQVAHELHDSVGQSLSAIKFAVEDSLKTLSAHSSAAELSGALERLQAIVPVVQQAIDEIRRIYMELRPSILDDLGILATINWFCRQSQKIYSNIRVEKCIRLEESDVPEQLKIIIFRVMQEAFHNASKHSKAGLVTVSLTRREETIELVIEDNGAGFDVDRILSLDSYKKGLGLASMQERTELSRGRFSIKSSLGNGTTIRSTWNVREIEGSNHTQGG